MRGAAYLVAAATAAAAGLGTSERQTLFAEAHTPAEQQQKVLGQNSGSIQETLRNQPPSLSLSDLDPTSWQFEPQSAGGCAACETLLLTLKLAAYRGDAAFIKTLTGMCLRGAVQDPDVCAGSIALEGPIAARALRGMRIGSATSRYFCATTVGLCDYPTTQEDDSGVELPPPRSPPSRGGERKRGTDEGKKTPLKVVHFSDIHVDPFYTEGTNANCTKPICCRDFSATDPPSEYDVPAGPHGDHRCDSPMSLEDSMYEAMERLVPDAAFSIFTGDIVDHAVWNTTKAQNALDIEHAYGQMGRAGGPVYATAGNHESSPTNSYKPAGDDDDDGDDRPQWLYDLLASKWSQWVGDGAGSQSRAFGAYSAKHPGSNLRVISLNTNLFYAQNYWLYSEPMRADPDGQLAWLAAELDAAERAGERAYVIGHMPPGSHDALHASSDLLDRIVNRYAGTVLAGLFFGHTHLDEFELSYAAAGDQRAHDTASAVWHVAASLTPTSGLPSFRVYDVDPDSFAVLDFTTYAADLDVEGGGPPRWRKLYSAREVYEPLVAGVAGSGAEGEGDEEVESGRALSPAFWHNVTVALERNGTALDEFLSRRRRGWSKVPGGPVPCRDDCARREVCKLRAARARDNCMEPAFRLGVLGGADEVGEGRGAAPAAEDECERSVLRDVLVQIMRPGRGDLRALLEGFVGELETEGGG